jgi:hypothetical protein
MKHKHGTTGLRVKTVLSVTSVCSKIKKVQKDRNTAI